jgi:CheY-like chemotaxis protein
MARVLIVEDSPTQAEVIRMMLEDEGHTVDVAGDGIAALERVRRAPPDIVATDLEMPRMNGLQLVEAVRRDHPSLPVILMTAHGSEEIAALALRKGAASYVPKSYLRQDILPTIQRILAVTHAARSAERALEHLTSTRMQFALDNDPAMLDPIIAYQDDLIRRLDLVDANERMRVGVALQEAILNAMYHGNLELDSELRQEDERHYHDLYRQRRTQLPYSTRRVHLDATLSRSEAKFVIRDDGKGFDVSALPDPTDPANLGRVGGRGLLIIRAFMDEVRHNSTGNEITCVKRRGGAAKG